MSKLGKRSRALTKDGAKKPVPAPTDSRRTIVAENGVVKIDETVESAIELQQALGSDEADFQCHTLTQVLSVIGAVPNMTLPGNAAIALMGAIKPTNEMEAALAAQMVAAHHFAMLSWSRAAKHTSMEGAQGNAAMANKASRTFTMQMEKLAKMRRGGEQVVRHVHVNEGGQAVIAETFNAGKAVGG